MYAFEDHHAHRDSPEDVDGYVTLRKIYWLIAHNIFRLKVNYKTNIINKRHIITFVPYKYE